MFDDQGSPLERVHTLVDLLAARAGEASARAGAPSGYRFLHEGGAEDLSFAELWARSRAVAATLRAAGLRPGDRALLLFGPGLEFIAAFFACLAAGVVAVPAYPPRHPRRLGRLQTIAADSGARAALTTADLLSRLAPALAGTPGLAPSADFRWLATDPVDLAAGADWRPPADLSGRTLAFLQYTSGSTSTPKGVMVSHHNLLHNERLIGNVFGVAPGATVVSWLPLHHDMGLIGGVLQPLWADARCVLFSPVAFLQRPARWLEAISAYRAEVSGGPNFAYELAARKVTAEEIAGFELSSWQVAFNGSEPVRAETLERFARVFAPAGFRPSAFVPCYGLAEVTLLVSGGPRAQGPVTTRVDRLGLESGRVNPNPAGRELVASGAVAEETTVRVVDVGSGTAVAAGEVGEIWVASASVAGGYWQRPEATAATFGARLPGDDRAYLRTGDLGFFAADGQLYVTGRAKDLIILRGRNLYPQDLEASAEAAHPALRAGASAAFAVEGPEGVGAMGERLVLAAEVDRQHREVDVAAVAAAIRQVLAEEHEAAVFAVVLLRHGTLPKTTSGKIQRHAARQGFLDGSLEILGQSVLDSGQIEAASEVVVGAAVRGTWAALDPLERRVRVEQTVREAVGKALGVAPASLPAQASLPLDSLAALELADRLESALGVPVPLAQLLAGGDLHSLVTALDDTLGTPERLDRAGLYGVPDGVPAPPVAPTAGGDDGELSDGERALWLLQRLEPESAGYNLAFAARWVEPMAPMMPGTAADPARLRAAFAGLVARHPTLRLRVEERAAGPWAVTHPVGGAGAGDGGFAWAELPSAAWSDEDLRAAFTATANTPFDLARGPLLRVHFAPRPDGPPWLLVVVHHLGVDLASLMRLLEELAAHLGGAATPPAPPLTYRDYARWQAQWLAGQRGEAAWSYWQAALAGAPTVLELPTDHLRPARLGFRGRGLRFGLATAEREAAEALARREGATLFALLLTTFGAVLSRWSGQTDLLVGSPTAGRTRPELRELVGYFVNPVPLRVQLDGYPTGVVALRKQRDVVLGALAHQDYPLLRLTERLQPVRDPSRSALFQVLLTLDRPQGPAGSGAFLLGQPGARLNLGPLELEALDLPIESSQLDLALAFAEATNGELVAELRGNAELFERATLDRFAGHFRRLLGALCARPEGVLAYLPLLSATEERQLTTEWNATARESLPGVTAWTIFEAQVERSPDAPALTFGGTTWTYHDLAQAAARFAGALNRAGVGPGDRVAVFLDRSREMVAALLGVWRAGAAYLPLDPHYPADRLGFMLADAGVRAVITRAGLAERLPPFDGAQVKVENVGGAEAPAPAVVAPESLAYVLYTSGSTGRPKGVMVPHRAVVNFFVGMDHAVGVGPGDRVLAATSISFDISVLELFWSLGRGAEVVLLADGAVASGVGRALEPTRPVAFSLFYFSSEAGAPGPGKYRLLLDGARFADRRGFQAVWTPERHFHAFGGIYPNPAITGAAVAAVTERVAIRAGSVVLPLHDPLRVAEEWSVVDNLSGGRVGFAVASGWHADDFVFFPERYADRKELTLQAIDTVRRLWRGEKVARIGGAGNRLEVATLPRPLQPELPLWLTAAGAPDTFVTAGRLGLNVLTHLLGQSLEELAERVALYRDARAEAGLDPAAGQVTLMLHTFVGPSREGVRETVRGPFTEYLRSSVGLIRNLAQSVGLPVDLDALSNEDMAALLRHAFDRYFDTGALFGSVADCSALVQRIAGLGVDEIACLIDFGVPEDEVLAGLEHLDQVRAACNEPAAEPLAVVAARHRPTVFQATPSMMRMVTLEDAAMAALGSLRALLLGGEALPAELAARLRERLPAVEQINVYGPTETTVWSATHPVSAADRGTIPIGRPITNTTLHVVDAAGLPLPVGVPGELWIGGDGVAHGYHGRPGLTAERFVPDAFGTTPGARRYRTGDRVVRRADGVLDFLGRVDFQVKIRGHRIEPGEIETQLAAHPAVAAAVVAAREFAPGDVRLCAWVVPAPAAPADLPAVLTTHLAERLPDYMVPAAVQVLTEFPRTPNQKVDRRALPDPRLGGSAHPVGRAPSTPTEVRLAEVWRELLGATRGGEIHAENNFFALGGHSLLATQLAARVSAVFEVELPLRAVFELPTLGGLAGAVDAAPPAAQRYITPRPPGTVPPLSYAQERLWFLDRLEPGNPTYNDRAAVRLSGRLDLGALAASLSAVVARHEVLRARFPARLGTPLQEILPPTTLPVPLVDLSGLAAERREQVLAAAAFCAARRPFDLSAGNLFGATLLRLAPREHALVLVVHHIVSDGWSIGVLVREVAALYPAFRAGEAAGLPPLAVQYGDYAAWQRERFAGDTLGDDLTWWRRELAGAPPLLELPLDRPRPAVRDPRGQVARFLLPADLVARLGALARAADASLFMVLTAGLGALLRRLTGRDDLVLGTPIAGRQGPQVEGLMGLFVNSLALRLAAAGDVSFVELLGVTRRAALGAYAHQQVPFDRVLEAVGAPRNVSHTPLFQVFFAFQNFPVGALDLPDLTLRPFPVDNGTVKFDWDLSLEEDGAGGLAGRFAYSAALFDPATIERFHQQWARLLAGAVEAPTQRLAALPLLAPEERHQVLEGWNVADRDYPVEAPVTVAISRQLAAQPQAVAVVAPSAGPQGALAELTYGALDEQSAALAARLAHLGVGPETVVGVFADRRLEVVPAVLGVVRSGAAYLPLDPDLPPARLLHLLRESDPHGPAVVVVLAHLAPRLAPVFAEWGGQVVTFDATPLATREFAPPPMDALAYVIYTSGSTGVPKGVMVSHHELANRVAWAAAAGHLAPGHRFLLNSSLSFDVSVFGLLGTLALGATVVLTPPGREADPDFLADLIRRARVDYAVFTPALLQALLERPELLAGTGLTTVASGGEAMVPELPQRFAAISSAAFYNRYGPTEATIYATSYRCRGAEPRRVVPIGGPTAKARLYVVDASGEPVPVGVAGELWIGGPGVARGYLDRPALTAEKFTPDPFGAPGARLYRTGDLVRWRGDGVLEFAGRIDHQVKVRGFRIELGEVQAALAAHPAVADAAARVWGTERGGKRLAGYVVVASGAALDESSLRGFLKERLPDYMVPQDLLQLAELPRTPIGKLDLAALPEPRPDATERPPFLAPASAAEVALAGLWAELLGVSEVGLGDNFFTLGGDSILSIRLIARAQELGFGLTPRDVFQQQTLGELAAVAVPVVGQAAAVETPPDPAEVPFWRHTLSGPVRPDLRRAGTADPGVLVENRVENRVENWVEHRIAADTAAALGQRVAEIFGAHPDECLLAAVLTTLVEAGLGVGRELTLQLQLGRTPFPLRCVLPPAVRGEARELLAVKEQLRMVPREGRGYHPLRNTTAELAALDEPPLWYALGQPPADAPPAVLAVYCQATPTGGYHLIWKFSAARFEPNTVTAWARRAEDHLVDWIAAATQARDVTYTPSDFADADLDQEQLESLLAELDRA